MTIIKMNAKKDLQIVKFDATTFMVQCLMGADWITIADTNTAAQARASFKSFGGK